MAEGLLLQSAHNFELDTSDTEVPTWSRLGAGLNNFELSLNEEVDQSTYLDGNGFASSDVTGGQLTLTFGGHRKYGDAAQDFIFDKMFDLGEERKTDFRWTQPDGTVIEGSATIANIEGPSGDANAKGEISFEIHINGKPTVTPAV